MAVDLFANNQPLPDEINKFDLLEAFLQIGVAKCFSHTKRPVFRPNVILHGLNSFRNILNGYEKGIFILAAISAGVRNVDIDMN